MLRRGINDRDSSATPEMSSLSKRTERQLMSSI